KIRVLAGFPAVIIKQIPVISSRDTVVVTCDAFDTNGTVKKYFWYREGYKLIDSTLEPEIAVRYYGRSPQKIICKVVDDDGLINHDSALIHFNRPPESTVKSPADTVSVGESEFPYPVKFIVSCSDPDSDTVKIKLHTGVDFDSMNIVYQGTDSIIPYNLTQPGETCWKLEVTDSWGNTVSHSGKFTTVLTHTICFVGHSIVEGMLSDHNHGGFRKGVIDGLRDSLPLHERLKSVGPLITPEMQSYPADDSCLAISGTTAKEIYLLLTRVSPQLKSDIWVLLLGVNDWYSTGEKNYIVKIIDIMLARNPASRVYVLNSVPVSEEHVYSGSINYNLPDFNKALEDSINVRRVGGNSVYLVNMFTLLTKDNAFDPTWFSDPLHPNQDGYDRIADEILRIMYQDSSRALRKPEEK
ncbi:MAG: SGNH/GDSL hydrolase family protein, partial [Fibrobacter sp.]|nr:SGNH/GDSL hydrolase family protein [Fibrobacter sp.]